MSIPPASSSVVTRLLLGVALSSPATLALAADAGFEAFMQRANAASKTEEGMAWGRSLNPVLKPIWQRAMQQCPRPSIFRIMGGLQYRFAMLLDAQGRVSWAGVDPLNASTRCALEMMKQGTYPPPPTGNYPFAITLYINKKKPAQ